MANFTELSPGYLLAEDIGGTRWVGPLLPPGLDPPVDLRWPEYVTTARGEEWCFPTPHAGTGAGEPL